MTSSLSLTTPGVTPLASTVSRRGHRLLSASIGAVWMLTALAWLHPYFREVGGAYLARLGLPAWFMLPACIAALLLGAAVMLGRARMWVSALQIALILAFTAVLASLEPLLLAHPFGMLSKNLPLLLFIVTAWLVERDGWTATARRTLRIGVAVVWLTEGLFPKLLFQQELELAMAPRLGLTFAPAAVLVAALGVAQISAGIAALWLEGRALRMLLGALAAVLVVLPLIVGSLEPTLWVHPFGPFIKNLPILVATLIAMRKC